MTTEFDLTEFIYRNSIDTFFAVGLVLGIVFTSVSAVLFSRRSAYGPVSETASAIGIVTGMFAVLLPVAVLLNRAL